MGEYLCQSNMREEVPNSKLSALLWIECLARCKLPSRTGVYLYQSDMQEEVPSSKLSALFWIECLAQRKLPPGNEDYLCLSDMREEVLVPTVNCSSLSYTNLMLGFCISFCCSFFNFLQ